MTNEEVQLLSDAIKIGFPVLGTIAGTIFGGVSTYLVTKLGYRNENIKDMTRRRFELLMQTANDIAEFEYFVGTFATALSNKIQELEGGADFEEARDALVHKNMPLRRARMSLKLLGLKDAEVHLEEYLKLTREVVACGTDLEQERASELAKIIVRGPVKFYECLSKEIALK